MPSSRQGWRKIGKNPTYLSCPFPCCTQSSRGHADKVRGDRMRYKPPEGTLLTNERFVRWQSHTMAQLSSVLSLLSGLSVAGLGFLFSLLREKDFLPAGGYALLFLIALAAFFVASATGIAAVIARLIDFRLTARKVRQGDIEEPLTFFGTDASGYGKATWRLFWVLVVSFSVAVLLASVVISHIYLEGIFNAVGF